MYISFVSTIIFIIKLISLTIKPFSVTCFNLPFTQMTKFKYECLNFLFVFFASVTLLLNFFLYYTALTQGTCRTNFFLYYATIKFSRSGIYITRAESMSMEGALLWVGRRLHPPLVNFRHPMTFPCSPTLTKKRVKKRHNEYEVLDLSVQKSFIWFGWIIHMIKISKMYIWN